MHPSLWQFVDSSFLSFACLLGMRSPDISERSGTLCCHKILLCEFIYFLLIYRKKITRNISLQETKPGLSYEL